MDAFLPGSLFDTHCHLDAAEFDPDRDAVLADAISAGVGALLIPAVEVANFAAVKALCDKKNRLANLSFLDAPQQKNISRIAAYGIHPMYTPSAQETDIAVLRQWLMNEQPAAVGEIGLDGFVPGLDRARQEWFFVEQLKLACEFDLPVVLHIRRAQDQVLKQLRRIGVKGGIAHAFNGSRQQADTFIKMGFKLGVGGAMTFSGSTRIRRLVTELPLESLVLETDAPDIPPVWLAGGRNTPGQLAAIAHGLAVLRGESPELIATITTKNALAVLSGNVEASQKS